MQVSLLVRSLHLRNMFVPTQWEWILAVACAQFLLKGFTKMICRKKICANCKASWLRSHTFSIFVSPPYFLKDYSMDMFAGLQSQLGLLKARIPTSFDSHDAQLPWAKETLKDISSSLAVN